MSQREKKPQNCEQLNVKIVVTHHSTHSTKANYTLCKSTEIHNNLRWLAGK